VATFTVAVTPRRPDGQSGFQDGDTSFIRCSAWRSLAEHVAELAKGDRVIIYGRLQQRSWQTEDGERRSSVEAQAEQAAERRRCPSANPPRPSRRWPDTSMSTSCGFETASGPVEGRVVRVRGPASTTR
jgi:single-strand DNA-binding protein